MVYGRSLGKTCFDVHIHCVYLLTRRIISYKYMYMYIIMLYMNLAYKQFEIFYMYMYTAKYCSSLPRITVHVHVYVTLLFFPPLSLSFFLA